LCTEPSEGGSLPEVKDSGTLWGKRKGEGKRSRGGKEKKEEAKIGRPEKREEKILPPSRKKSLIVLLGRGGKDYPQGGVGF